LAAREAVVGAVDVGGEQDAVAHGDLNVEVDAGGHSAAGQSGLCEGMHDREKRKDKYKRNAPEKRAFHGLGL